MPPQVIIAYPGFGDITVERDLLHAAGLDVVHTQTTTTPAAQAALRHADAVMVTTQPVTAEMIADMERCRIISRVGTGLDALDIPAATARGIWVTYVPDYSIDEVATHAITLLLAQARGLAPLLQSTRRGEWDQRPAGVVQRLCDQTLGVIGFGRIGRAAAAKGRGLGLRVVAHDDYVPETVFNAAGVTRVDLATLLAESDYITLHTPLTGQTRHLINAATLAQMKPSVYLINTARGPLVDEDALLAAVRGGQIAGAALDVLTTEPPASDHPLLHEPRILITPHIAWYSEAAKHDVRLRGAEEVIRVLQGQPPRAPVNQLSGASPAASAG